MLLFFVLFAKWKPAEQSTNDSSMNHEWERIMHKSMHPNIKFQFIHRTQRLRIVGKAIYILGYFENQNQSQRENQSKQNNKKK